MNGYSSRPVVAVARSEGYYEGTERALDLIEDQIEAGVRGKRRLVVKPNFVSTRRQLAATHVNSVRAVLDVVTRHYNGGVTVAEGPALGSLERGVSNFGYDRLVDEYGVEFVDLNGDEYEVLEGFDRRLEPLGFRVSRTILESDYLISVARAKTHDCVIATLSIKNVVVGALVTKREKERIHQGTRAINLNIARLAEGCMPKLGVIDGYIGMEGRGPVNGDPVELGVAAASLHPVSLDAVMAEIMGFKALDIGYLHHLDAWGAGVADIGGIEVLGKPIEEVGVKFRPHPTYKDQLKWR
jgi:uncharacterized protein (DUF362 family)